MDFASVVSTGVGEAAVFGPIGIVVTASMTRGIRQDCKNGSSRNTTEAIVGSACAVGAGITGGATGAQIGTMVCPGVGTLIGAFLGALFGAALADCAGKKLASEVFDHWEYNINIIRCGNCSRRFKCRVYTAQSRQCCPMCDKDFVIGC